jgi:hypothetical protein
VTVATPTEIDRLRDRLRSTRWMAVIALGFGLGIGFYAGFSLGVQTAREVDAIAPQTAE